ncbi:hypothetical protein CsatB_010451 [Cannabis sativa]
MMQKFWDAEVRSMFGDFIWQGHKDASRANFDQAVKASPDDCFVLASYARFLWDYEEDDDEEETNTESSTPNFFRGTTLLLLKLSTLVRDLLYNSLCTTSQAFCLYTSFNPFCQSFGCVDYINR